ncbi:MAG: DUF1616 domain-containing protein, partial [archaeon]
QFPFLNAVRAFLGFFYILFLPGYVIVRCFYDELDPIEKAALSFGLSIAVVILSIMFSNLILKIPITAAYNFLVILAVIGIVLLLKWKERPIQRLGDRIRHKLMRYPLLRKLF